MATQKRIVDLSQTVAGTEQIFEYTGIQLGADGSWVIGGDATSIAEVRADDGDQAPIGSIYLSTTTGNNYTKIANNGNDGDWTTMSTGPTGPAGATGVTGATGPSGTGILTAQVILNNTDILALNSTPIQIVPATGVSTEVIMPLSATMAYTRSTASYATNTELNLIHSGSSQSLMKTDIGAGASTFAPLNHNDYPTPSGNVFIANADLNVFVPIGNPTGGDAGSSIIITVVYTIMNAI